MTTDGHDMALEQFIRSKWFIATARAAAIVGATVISIGGGIVTWAVFDTRASASTANASAAAVASKQAEREPLIDAAIADVRRQVNDSAHDIDVIRAAQITQGNDIATIKGILLRQDVAGRLGPPPSLSSEIAP